MKICVLSRGVPDGRSPLNGMYEWGLAVTLKSSGYETVVVAVDLRRGRKRKKIGLTRYEKEGVEVWDYGIPTGRLAKGAAARLRLAVIARTYAAMAKEGSLPDLTWAFFCRTFGRVAGGLKKLFGVPYVISEYESRLLTEGYKGSERRTYAPFYENAAARTAPNEAFAARLKDIFGCEFVPLPQSVGEPAEKTPHEGFVFLSQGALTAEKGMDVVIRAFARVKRSAPQTRLVISGNGEERGRLMEQAKALGVENSVEFKPYATGSIGKRIAESDCFVLASRRELIGSIYLAPLAAGIPVLTTECFSPKGLIPDFAGAIVPVDDASALAEAMKTACSENSPYDSEEITRYAKNSFSPAAIAKKIEEITKAEKNEMPAADIR